MAVRVESLALYGWRPVNRIATAWLCRAAEKIASSDDRARKTVETVCDVMRYGDDAKAQARATATVERLWAGGSPQRQWIWDHMWECIDVVLRSTYIDQPPSVFARFLFAPDPRHESKRRLFTGLQLPGDHDRTMRLFWMVVRRTADPDLRADVVRVMSATDDPGLVTRLEEAFRSGLRNCLDDDLSPRYARERGDLLWKDDHPPVPTPLLEAVIANPHIPRGADLPLLCLLRDRFDLLARFNQRHLVGDLLRVASMSSHHPLAELCRHALRTFGPGEARAEVCAKAMEGNWEAIQACVDAGYGPDDPWFLLLTRQWNRFLAADPDGRRLSAHGVEPGRPDGRVEFVDRLLGLLDGSGVPAAVRDFGLLALREVGAGPARERLCERALTDHDSRIAWKVVSDAGHLPADEARIPAFLFRTQQWHRYDAFDPDGSLLRRYTDGLAPDDLERSLLCLAAYDGGRDRPCEPVPAGRRSADHPGVSGAGRYVGGDFSGGFGGGFGGGDFGGGGFGGGSY